MVQLTLDSHARISLAIDVTGSMSTCDCPDGLSRLQYACQCVELIVETAPPQLRSVDIMAFGTTLRFWGEVRRDEVPALLRRLTACEAQTYTASVVSKAARMLVPGRSGALVIFTDGEPRDPAMLAQALGNAPALHACAVSVGNVWLETVVARAEDVSWCWGPRSEFPPPRSSFDPDERELTQVQWPMGRDGAPVERPAPAAPRVKPRMPHKPKPSTFIHPPAPRPPTHSGAPHERLKRLPPPPKPKDPQ